METLHKLDNHQFMHYDDYYIFSSFLCVFLDTMLIICLRVCVYVYFVNSRCH